MKKMNKQTNTSSKLRGKKSKESMGQHYSEMDNSKAGADSAKIQRHRRFLMTGR